MTRAAKTIGPCVLTALISCLTISAPSFGQSEDVLTKLQQRVDSGDLEKRLADQLTQEINGGQNDIANGVALHTVEWERTYQPMGISPVANSQIRLQDGKIDLEGNMILRGSYYPPGALGGGYFVAKFDGDDGALSWETIQLSTASDYLQAWDLAVDLDGNSYVTFERRDTGTVFESNLARYSPQGNKTWEVDLGIDPDWKDARVRVDEDQNIYVIGRPDNVLTVQRYRPDGVRLWTRQFEPTTLAVRGAAIDRLGNLFVYSEPPVSELRRLRKIDPAGNTLWSKGFNNDGSDGQVAGPFLDIDCNSYVIEDAATYGRYIAISYDADGTRRYLTTTGSALPDPAGVVVGAVDRDGNFYIAGGAGNSLSQVCRVSPEGAITGQNIYDIGFGGLQFPTLLIALDRFGNPYLCGSALTTQTTVSNGFVYKLDRNNFGPVGGPYPAPVWTHELGAAGFSLGYNGSLALDYGDSVWYSGGDVATNGNTSPGRARLGKISQPYTDVLKIIRNAPNLQINNQSLWGEFVGGVSATQSIFQITASQTAFSILQGAITSIIPFGDFGGGVTYSGNAAFGLGFEATASGGKVDISYPGDLDIALPGAAKLVADTPFDLLAQFDPHASANIVSDGTPELSAGLAGNAAINLNATANLVAASDTIASVGIANAHASWSGLIPGLSMSLPTGSPGSWVDFGDEQNLVSGRLKRPLFTSSGGLDLSDGKIVSTLEPEVFFSLRGNMTNYISTYQFGTPTIYSVSSGNSSAWSLGAGVNIAQAYAELGLEANQSLTYEPSVSVIYEFDPPVTVHPDGGPVQSNQLSWEVPLVRTGATWSAPLTISVPAGSLPANNAVSIRPRSKVSSTLKNHTWVDIQPLVGWETLAASASATAAGIDLFSFDFCALCYGVPLSPDIPITLFQTQLDLPDTIVELDPMQVVLDPSAKPEVGSTSRTRLSAFIYDQVDADPFELAAFVNQPAKRMLIYGNKFNSGGVYQIANFVMCLNGRLEPLPTTILNSRTALVEVPNVMRLVPGVARIWAVNGSGQAISDSIDFPIELPMPRLGTVGPNLWASDPRISNIAIDAIDGLTPAGLPSFIARRDYWYVLADMWDFVFGTSEPDLFSSFPLYDFTAPPPIPTVLIERDELTLVPDRTHDWNFDGDFFDSINYADATPQGLTPEFTTSGVPPFLKEAVILEGDAIEVPAAGIVPFGTGDFSIAYWVKRNELGNSFRLIADANRTAIGFAVYFQDGVPGISVIDDSTPTLFRFNSDVVVGDTNWHHYAVSVKRDDPTGVNWYIDGQLVTTLDSSPRNGFIDVGKAMVFGEQDNGSSVLNGELANFTLFNRAITSDEALRMANPVNSTPIPRFRQPVENGILYSLMPVSDYDEPALKSIRLSAPGPGGGESNAVTLTVAAPKPLVSNITPKMAIPGSDAFEITVEGPLSVPYFAGFEEERFGNFNKASVVYWDEIPLQTKFVSPAELRAIVPAGLTTTETHAFITVRTPNKGTGYFDAFSGNIIPSGGTSNAQAFAVRYPSPVITAISPEVTSKAVIDRCPDNPGVVTLQISGKDFYPGTTIWIDSVPYPTNIQTLKAGSMIINGNVEVEFTNDVLTTLLTVQDLDRVLSAPVIVVNPDGYASNEVTLEIVDQAGYEAYFGVTLPPQALPGGCK